MLAHRVRSFLSRCCVWVDDVPEHCYYGADIIWVEELERTGKPPVDLHQNFNARNERIATMYSSGKKTDQSLVKNFLDDLERVLPLIKRLDPRWQVLFAHIIPTLISVVNDTSLPEEVRDQAVDLDTCISRGFVV